MFNYWINLLDSDGSVSFPDKIEVPEDNETVEICTSLQSEGRLESDLIITLNISDGIAGKVIDTKYMGTFRYNVILIYVVLISSDV